MQSDTASPGPTVGAMSPPEGVSAQTRQFTTFWLGGLLFGVEATLVQEVLRYQEITPVPLAAAAVRGLINLRGQIVTTIDLKRRIGLADRGDDTRLMNVLVRTADGLLLERSAAARHIMHRLGGAWRLIAIVTGWIPRPVLDIAYDSVARVRHRLFRKPSETCPLLPAELRSRFQP